MNFFSYFMNPNLNKAFLDKLIESPNKLRADIIKSTLMNKNPTIQEEDEIRNIIVGDISGAREIFFAHYDSYLEGYGAYDNCAGIVSLLSIAYENIDESISFCFFDKEESGQLGAKLFLKKYHSRLKNNGTQTYNIDGVGIGDKIIGVDYMKTKSPYRTDSTEFISSGIPSTHLFTVDEKGKTSLLQGLIPQHIASIIHTTQDNLGYIDWSSIESMTATIKQYLSKGEKKWDNLGKISMK
jgi:hypothetical protein